jgi:hypothetical protein
MRSSDVYMSDWEKVLLDEAVERLSQDVYWQNRLTGWGEGGPLGFAWHLAIFVEPFLSYVLDGTKVVESRFSINRAEPYKRVAPMDILLLKTSGGPIVGAAEVSEVTFYQLNAEELERILERFGEALRVEDEEFWTDRRDSCYASIIGISHVTPFRPLDCDKRDKRGWVRLQYQPTLMFG